MLSATAIDGKTITGATLIGGDGLYYNGTPGPGTLYVSISDTGGVDQYGNTVQPGVTIYSVDGMINLGSGEDTIATWAATNGGSITIGAGGGSATQDFVPPPVSGVNWEGGSISAASDPDSAPTPPAIDHGTIRQGTRVHAEHHLVRRVARRHTERSLHLHPTHHLPRPDHRAQHAVGYALGLFHLAVVHHDRGHFPHSVSAGTVPNVMTNIASGDGTAARWGSRAISVTNTGFTLFLFKGDSADAAQTWSNIPVQWWAHA